MGPDLLLMATDFFVKYGNPDADAFVAWHRSQRRRCGMTVRFSRPDVRQATDNSLGSDWRPILLAGEDRRHHFTLAEPPFPG